MPMNLGWFAFQIGTERLIGLIKRSLAFCWDDRRRASKEWADPRVLCFPHFPGGKPHISPRRRGYAFPEYALAQPVLSPINHLTPIINAARSAASISISAIEACARPGADGAFGAAEAGSAAAGRDAASPAGVFNAPYDARFCFPARLELPADNSIALADRFRRSNFAAANNVPRSIFAAANGRSAFAVAFDDPVSRPAFAFF